MEVGLVSMSGGGTPISVFSDRSSGRLGRQRQLRRLGHRTGIRRIGLSGQLGGRGVLVKTFLNRMLTASNRDRRVVQRCFTVRFPSFLAEGSSGFLFGDVVRDLNNSVNLNSRRSSFRVRRGRGDRGTVRRRKRVGISTARRDRPRGFIDAASEDPLSFSLNRASCSSRNDRRGCRHWGHSGGCNVNWWGVTE